jgi:hypothetical protein
LTPAPPPDFDWVPARIACRADRAFERLFERVTADVATVNTALGVKRFEVSGHPAGDTFTVWDAGQRLRPVRRAVDFALANNTVVVRLDLHGRQTDTERTYRLVLDEAGQCRFDSQVEQLALWQVARWALEDLLFEDHQ